VTGRASIELPPEEWDWENLTDLQKVVDGRSGTADLDTVVEEVRRDPSLARFRWTDGLTLLHEAAWAQHAPLVRVLLAAGADPNARNGHHEAPLHRAGGATEVIGLLLDAGADLHALDGWGQNALSLAVRYGDEAAVRFLLARGAVPCDERSRAWVAWASGSGQAEPGAAPAPARDIGSGSL
jgi:hypothetical protein